MPKLKSSLPKYRLHRASGQAVVTLYGKDIYLGPWRMALPIHPNLPSQIRRLVACHRKQNNRWLAAAKVPAKRKTFFGPTKRLPGESDWQNLVSITERALADASKCKPWLTLGQALEHYVVDIYPPHGAGWELPDLVAVIERARALNEAGVTILEIKRLAECEVDKQQDCAKPPRPNPGCSRS